MCTTEPLSWRVHPLRQESRLKSGLLVLTIGGVAAIAGLSFGGALYGVLSLAILGASMSRYLLPTAFRLDPQGARVDHGLRGRTLTWSQVRRVDAHADGLFLSPFARPCRLDAFRGAFLRYAGNGARVRSAVDAYRAAGGHGP